MNTDIKDIRRNIVNGETMKALQVFIDITNISESNKKTKDINKQLTLLHAELTRVNKDYNSGFISYEAKNISFRKGDNLILILLNEFLVSNDDEAFNINLKTIKSFTILAIATLIIVLIFGSYFYMPREQSSVPFFLLIIYSIIFFTSISIVLIYTYLNFGKSIKLAQAITLVLIFSILFCYAPYISTIIIQGDSKQDAADSRYLSGNWEGAMFIYIKERYKLNNKSTANVIEMKRLLNKAGYYIDEINQTPNMRVIESLKKMQKDFNLAQDGYVERETGNVLYGTIFKKELELDSENTNINELTRKIQIFQQRNQLFDDGVIGEKTLETLKNKRKFADIPINK